MESQSSLIEKALLLACADPEIKTASQAYDFVLSELSLDDNKRPAVRRVKGTLVKKLERIIKVLK